MKKEKISSTICIVLCLLISGRCFYRSYLRVLDKIAAPHTWYYGAQEVAILVPTGVLFIVVAYLVYLATKIWIEIKRRNGEK